MSKLFAIKGFLPYLIMLFLNAFVDLGHKIIIQNTVFKVFDGEMQIILTAIVNALMLIPFIVLFSPSGFIADKYPKQQVMRYSAVVEVIIVLLITAAYYAGWFWCAFALTLLLAMQAAIYSPAKYGYIRELVGDHNLAQANAMVQAGTMVAILAGTFVFSAGFEIFLQANHLNTPEAILPVIAPLGWLLVALAAIEWFCAQFLPARRQTDSNMQFAMVPYLCGQYLRTNIKVITGQRVIWLSIVGLSVFWAICQVLLATFPAFAKDILAESNTMVIQGILASSGVGIMLGSLMAGRMSKNYIELGLIPAGALGLAITIGIMPMLDHAIAMALTFLLMGVFGGILIVPLNALIQYHAHEDDAGIILAGNNWVQNAAMLVFLVFTVVFAYYGFNSQQLFYGLMLVALCGAGYTVYQLPHSLARIVGTLIFRQRYNLEVVGFDNLPKTGGVLLLGNHISWIDWAIMQMACPRPVRYVMLRSYYNQWYLKPFCLLFGAIPIGNGNSKESLQLINEKLQEGEVVCLFPEGAISRTGALGMFHGGYERAVEGVHGVIVPFYMHGLWGSVFSRANSSKLRRNTLPGLRRNITVTFGPALPMDIKASELKQKVFEVAFHAWESHSDYLDPLPLAWVKAAREQLRSVSVIDSNGMAFSNASLLAITFACAQKMHHRSPEKNIGIMLPSGSAAIIANMAAMLNNHAVVNINYSSGVTGVQSAVQQAGLATVYTSGKFLDTLKHRGIDTDAMLHGVTVITMESLVASVSRTRQLVNYVLACILPARVLYNAARSFGNRARPLTLDDPAAILFSSGSEHLPKGIVLSHRNIMANIKQISDVFKIQDTDTVMGCLPPFHSFGFTVTTMLPLIEGIPLVCHPDPADVLNIAKAISKYNVTILCATSSTLRLYNKNRKVHSLMLDSLRIVVAGAEKLADEVRSEFQDKFNKIIYEGYGATETTPVASVNIPDQLDTDSWTIQRGRKIGTVGLPVPGCSFRIVDPQSLKPMPIREDGLILVSGTQVMLGYLNDPEKTAAAIIELDGRRWYKSGDKGHVDEDGFLTIVDRYSRFAKIEGEMISLGAVEKMVQPLLGKNDAECVAVNIPHAKKGEQLVLLVNTPVTTYEVQQQLLATNVNPLMMPAQVFPVDKIPRLGNGKTDYESAKQHVLEFITAGLAHGVLPVKPPIV